MIDFTVKEIPIEPVALFAEENMGEECYFAAFFAFAQRALTAATILARPSGEIFRFFVPIGVVLTFGPPGLRFLGVPLKRFLASWRRAISVSSSAIICLVPIQ